MQPTSSGENQTFDTLKFLFYMLGILLIIILAILFQYVDLKKEKELANQQYQQRLREKFYHHTLHQAHIDNRSAKEYIKRLQNDLMITPKKAATGLENLNVKHLLPNNRLDESQSIKPQYLWPIAISSSYTDIIQTLKKKRGLAIPAKLGDPVVAIQDGYVAFSNSDVRGYGKLIVIKHNEDIMSIYGNNHINYVSKGDEVKKGQIIALVGETPKQESHLYFEIRYKGTPTPPLKHIVPHRITY